MTMFSVLLFTVTALLACGSISVSSAQLDYLPNSLLQDFLGHITSDQHTGDSFENGAINNGLFIADGHVADENYRIRKDGSNGDTLMDRYRFQTRDDILLPREPVPRKEFLEHSSLYGHQYMQGGAGEGQQRLKPDGSVANIQVIKSDSVLPAYCNPPNPCPLGYTGDDGCLEEFSNTADFSKDYQASQECMCDNEHMFACPGSTDENELETLARSIQNEGLMDSTMDKILENMHTPPNHKVVAKKFFIKRSGSAPLKKVVKRSVDAGASKASKKAKSSKLAKNPFLQGYKLPVVAKKSPHLAKL